MGFLTNIFKSKMFYLNLVGIFVFFTIIYLVLNEYLDSYTMHGKSVSVPNLIGMQYDEAIEHINEKNFNYKIIDTVYDSRYEKGSVVNQDPVPEAGVKKGRRIYLTINSNVDELVSMPQLVGNSMRQASLIAESYGIIIGDISYVPDIAKNVVIKQMYKNKEIDANRKIKKHSKIDIVLGLGIGDEKTNIPLLIGLTFKEAYAKLHEAYLNTGLIMYDKDIKTKKDSLEARIYRQDPSYSTINQVNLGYNIDIWLTKDKDLLDKSQEEVNNTIEIEEETLKDID